MSTAGRSRHVGRLYKVIAQVDVGVRTGFAEWCRGAVEVHRDVDGFAGAIETADAMSRYGEWDEDPTGVTEAKYLFIFRSQLAWAQVMQGPTAEADRDAQVSEMTMTVEFEMWEALAVASGTAGEAARVAAAIALESEFATAEEWADLLSGAEGAAAP